MRKSSKVKHHKKRRHTTRRRITRKKGGNATNLPAPYFKAPLTQPSANAGYDLLKAVGDLVRPKIGGGRTKHRRIHKKKGGFVPSIMEGFSQMAGKYVLPLALFSGYKLMNTRKSNRK